MASCPSKKTAGRRCAAGQGEPQKDLVVEVGRARRETCRASRRYPSGLARRRQKRACSQIRRERSLWAKPPLPSRINGELVGVRFLHPRVVRKQIANGAASRPRAGRERK